MNLINLSIQKNKWTIIYFFTAIVAILPILEDVILKGKINYGLVVSRSIGLFFVIYAVESMGRWGVGFAIIYFGFQTLMFIVALILYIINFGIAVIFSNPEILPRIIFPFFVAIISTPLMLIFKRYYKDRKFLARN